MLPSIRFLGICLASFVFCLLGFSHVTAGQTSPPGTASAAGSSEDPPSPIAPDVIARGANGRVVVRATRLREPLRVDGNLDEAIYQSLTPLTGFIQGLPTAGAPATERTEAWITFDADYLYISGKCYESVPPEQWTANELRRDTSQLRQNDTFGALIWLCAPAALC